MQDPSDSTSSPNRQGWPVRLFRLGSEPGPDLSASTTPQQRLDMVWPLTLAAWALTGRPMPKYPRSETPVRKRPLTSAPVD